MLFELFDDLFGETYRADSPLKKKKVGQNHQYVLDAHLSQGQYMSGTDLEEQDRFYANTQQG